jgi:hypothetical protein
MLLEEFLRQHVDEKLAPKTIERYHEQAAYLDPELLTMPIADITSLHLTREWNRLLKRGGHHRRTKQPRPLSAKTVRNIAGVVSSGFARAIRWGLTSTNPVTNSEPPRVKKHHGIALTPAQQATVQTKQVLKFKGTKSERPRVVKVPESTLATLEAHRKHQDEFRRQFGPDYRTDLERRRKGCPRPRLLNSVQKCTRVSDEGV